MSVIAVRAILFKFDVVCKKLLIAVIEIMYHWWVRLCRGAMELIIISSRPLIVLFKTVVVAKVGPSIDAISVSMLK